MEMPKYDILSMTLGPAFHPGSTPSTVAVSKGWAQLHAAGNLFPAYQDMHGWTMAWRPVSTAWLGPHPRYAMADAPAPVHPDVSTWTSTCTTHNNPSWDALANRSHQPLAATAAMVSDRERLGQMGDRTHEKGVPLHRTAASILSCKSAMHWVVHGSSVQRVR